jgi:hypothetical protein
MNKYSIWIETTTGRSNEKVIVIYKENNPSPKALMQLSVGRENGTLALSNGALIEYDMLDETFGIIICRNSNTHIYRDGETYAIKTEDKLEWVMSAPDVNTCVWVKRD